MGETKRVPKPMKKSPQQLQNEVAEIHPVPDLIRDENGGEEEEEEEIIHHHPYLHHHPPEEQLQHEQDPHQHLHQLHSRLVGSEQDLLELEFDEDILELHGYHHQPASLVGHVNSSCSFIPFDSRSAASTAASPTSPSLFQRPSSISTSSTVAAASHHHQLYSAAQESCSAYFKLTGSRRGDPPGRKVSDATKEEIQEDDDEASLRELLMSGGSMEYGLQQQVTVMSMNLSSKLDELQSDRHFETTVALSEIRTQLQELTKSVESCQSEVVEVKRDMVAIKTELDAVQQVKEEIEELREYVDRLEEQSHRRKALLLRQIIFCIEENIKTSVNVT